MALNRAGSLLAASASGERLLLGLYQPDQGQIEVDGVPLTALDPDAWRDRCTAAFQDFSRFNLAAVESVGLADLPRLDDEPAAQAALDRAAAAARGAAATTGTVTVLVSHRFATVQMADLIIFMEDGRAVEIGSHDELLGAEGRYAELFGLQAEAFR